MQALVTYPYRDRETDEVHLAGETVELTAERFRELSLKNFVSEMPAESAAGAAPTAASEPVAEQPSDASAMTSAQLRAAIEARGGFAPKKATKAQLASILGSL